MLDRPAPLLAAAAAFLVFTVASPSLRAADWREDYRRALKALDAGRLGQARDHLTRAVAANPSPAGEARTYGTRRTGYFPYLHFGILSYRERDLAEAEKHLLRARTEGAVLSSEQHARLLRKHELLVENLQFLRARDGAQARRSDSDLRREQVLAEQVAEQCGEPPPRPARNMPWYYHYRLASKLAQHGDWVGSLQQLALSLERRDEPGKYVRTYGVQFMTYRPWFEMGRAHAHLGNWKCAADALQLSTEIEEFPANDRSSARERDELLAGAVRRLTPN